MILAALSCPSYAEATPGDAASVTAPATPAKNREAWLLASSESVYGKNSLAVGFRYKYIGAEVAYVQTAVKMGGSSVYVNGSLVAGSGYDVGVDDTYGADLLAFMPFNNSISGYIGIGYYTVDFKGHLLQSEISGTVEARPSVPTCLRQSALFC